MKTLAIALIALSTLSAQEPTLLRRTFQAGSVDTYKIEDKVVQTVKSAMGEMPVTITSSRTYSIRTVKIDEAAGTAQIEGTTTIDKLDATGPAAALMGDKPKPVTQTGKIDVRGRITFDAAPSADAVGALVGGSQSSISAGTFVEFPEKPVKVGDSWDIVVPKSPLVFDQDQRLTATLIGEKEYLGKSVWVVTVKGIVRTAVDSSKFPAGKSVDSPLGPMTIRVKGQVDLTGEGLVDKSSGRTLSMTTKGASKMAIDLVEAGLTLDTAGTVESTAKLAP